MESSDNETERLFRESEEISAEIMEILQNGNRDDFVSYHGILPSVYTRQMLLTTEERTANTIKQQGSNLCLDSCFRATPNIVVFQQFFPGNSYCVKLSLKNITLVPQHLKMTHTKDQWFTIEARDIASCKGGKLAPGMSVVCDVNFFPDERRDYKFYAVFAMLVESFVVPILAIGPRPLLDLPDSIDVPKSAINMESSKFLLVRNTGTASGAFTFSTVSPFSVHPQKGVLAEGETMQVSFNFLSSKKGCFREQLSITFETGEVISLELRGSADTCVVALEETSIRFEDTYLGLTRSTTFRIYNRSDFIINFRWVLDEEDRPEKPDREIDRRFFGLMKDIEAVCGIDFEHYDTSVPPVHESAYQRVYADEQSSLSSASSNSFRHPNYKLIPTKGVMWPHSEISVTLIFEPDEVGVVSGIAYLEASGCAERIPLSMHGVCLGPLIKLNATLIDLGRIFLCSIHNIEVVCANQSDIPGTVAYLPRPVDFGGKIKVNPLKLRLKPGEYKSFNVSFSSKRIGDFTETVDFSIKESLQTISLQIKGSVVPPTLRFDKEYLDFGITALGFTTRREACLHNSSLVPVAFYLIVTEDGTQPTLTREDFAKCPAKTSLADDPKEFTIIPCEGVVAPQSFQRIKILYTPNMVRLNGQAALRAEMWDSDSEPITLPLSFTGKVATFVVRPSEVIIRFSFINFPYTRSITVENKSDVEGFFHIPSQPVQETVSSAVMYSLAPYKGYLKANESKSISLEIITSALGKQKLQLSLLVLGETNPLPCCTLICNGQGPVVTVEPSTLDWGEVRLQDRVSSVITLFSDTPIPTQFVAGLRKTSSPWTVRPASGTLEPNGSLDLEVTLYLRDAGQYTDTLAIEIINSRVIGCTLSALGIGTSVDFNPKMMDVFDMGLLFKDQDISIPITMENKGTKHHRLTWSTAADIQAPRQSGALQEQHQNKFVIDPSTVELPPSSKGVIHCKIRWGTNESITEQWYLYGQIKGQRKRELYGSSLFKAKFTDPNIQFSRKKLEFRYDMAACGTETQPNVETVFVTNRSSLDLTVRVSIDPPFEIIADDVEKDPIRGATSWNMFLPCDVKTPVRITFNTQTVKFSNLYSKKFRRLLTFEYETHRTKDTIECVVELSYPNISLQPSDPAILTIDSGVGSTAYKTLTLINAGHLPVRYEIGWIPESTVIDGVCGKKSEFSDGEADGLRELEEPLADVEFQADNKGPDTRLSFTQVDPGQIRDLLYPIIERYVLEDNEISAIEDSQILDGLDQSRSSPRFLTEVLDVAPESGVVLAHSSQCVHFVLDALQRTDIGASVMCRVESGPTEMTNVRATADVFRYSIDKNCIDFGRRPFGEICRTTLKIANLGVIRLNFEAHQVHLNDHQNETALKLTPRCGTVDPASEIGLEILYHADVPGTIREEFDLEIADHAPILIRVGGYVSLPQLYLTGVSRHEEFERLPAELCYRAIADLTSPQGQRTDSTNEAIETRDDVQFPESGWELISHYQTLPSPVDIVMAIERSLTVQLLSQNPQSLHLLHSQRDASNGRDAMATLSLPGYVIDMGFVAIGQVACYSTTLFNYGPAPADVHLIRSKNKLPHQESGFVVHFQNRKMLPVGESTPLNVTFHPTGSSCTGKRTDVEHTIHLAVFQGAPLLVSVRAVATYPILTAHTDHLSFEKVAVGNCKLMPILLRNNGWIPCEWEATIRAEERSLLKGETTGPFFLDYRADDILPGEENIVNVYFKPTEAKHTEGQLRIKVKGKCALPIDVSISGTGIGPDVIISEKTLTFDPVLPYHTAEKTLQIENRGSSPVELYWLNQDTISIEEERAVRILTHYYGVDQVLLPPRNPGDRLPLRVFNFCQTLADEMTQTFAGGTMVSRMSEGGKSAEGYDQSVEIVSNPDQTEALLHCYIDELRKREGSEETTMRDPIREVLADEDHELASIDHPSQIPRFCIIFHGAPFTEYQEAACRVGRTIGVPVLNITNAITEVIASGTSPCSEELRNIVDENYNKLLLDSENYRSRKLEAEADGPNGSAGEIDSPSTRGKSLDVPDSERAPEPGILEELERSLGPVGELESMTPVDRYEYKIQALLNLQKDVYPERSERAKNSRRDEPKSSGTAETFLGINADLIHEALNQRLTMKDYQLGFTVQTMDNIFIRNEYDTLVMLLKTIGNDPPSHLLFVTFHNTFDMYLSQQEKFVATEKLRATEEMISKLKAVEEMTGTEYEQTSRENKLLYAAETLASKRAACLRRRLIYNHRARDAKLDENTWASTGCASIPATRMGSSKTKRSDAAELESMRSFPEKKDESNQPLDNRGMTNRISRKETPLPADLEVTSKLMDSYRKSLATLQPVLDNWDPRECNYDKTGQSNGLEVWYVAPSDPWNSEIYSWIASHIAGVCETRKAMSAEAEPTRGLNAKLYSVVGRKSSVPWQSTIKREATYTEFDTSVRFSEAGKPHRPSNFRIVDEEEALSPRWVMDPGQLLNFKVQFTPKGVGMFKDEYVASVVGSNISYRIQVEGSADVPRLSTEPNVIFSKVESSKLNDLNKPAYFLDSDTFDFGSILLPTNKQTRVDEREEKFVLKNISTVLAAVAAYEIDDSNAFHAAPGTLNIAPGETNILKVRAGVSKIGTNSARLLLCVENNPQVEVIHLRSHGSKLEVELEGGVVSFGKILLRRTEKRNVIVRNKSTVPIYWRLEVIEGAVDSQVTLYPERGFVGPLATTRIECRYHASLVGVKEKKALRFQVFVDADDAEPLLTDSITVSGETYDVKVDVTDASPIDFKVISVGTTAVETISMTNRGPCDIEFIVRPNNPASLAGLKLNIPPSTLSTDFKLEPTKGSLSPGESSPIVVKFTPRGEFTVFDAPLLLCHLVDVEQKPPTSVAEFPLLVSVSTHYSKFRISPSSLLDFGSMALFETQTMYFNVENFGYFPFSYKINASEIPQDASDRPSVLGKICKSDETVDDKAETEKLGSIPSTAIRSSAVERTPRIAHAKKSSRHRKSEEKNFSLRAGPFLLSKDNGKVEAGEVETIAVQCCPQLATKFDVEVGVIVTPDAGTDAETANKVQLSVNGCIPAIDLHNVDAILREHPIVDSVTDLTSRNADFLPKIGAHTIFGRQENSLYFRRVCISNTHAARLRLHNPGLVPAEVVLTLGADPNISGDGNTNMFTIDPHDAKIAPMSTGIFTVSFAPTAVGNYTATLRATLVLPPPLDRSHFDIRVCGESTVPMVAFLESKNPSMNDQINKSVNFERNPVGQVSCRSLTLENIGSVEARVIAEMTSDANCFTIEAAGDYYDDGLNRRAAKDARRVLLRLVPGGIVGIEVKFAPTEVGRYEGRVHILTLGNPDEYISLNIRGESYQDDVIIEGLECGDDVETRTSLAGKRASRSRHSQLDTPVAEITDPIRSYKLNYGKCFISETKRICFKINSRSENQRFHFEWSSHPNIAFSPSTGHLGLHGSMEILATFYAVEPTVHTGTRLECKLTPISDQLYEGTTDQVYWEETQMNTKGIAGCSGASTKLQGERIRSKEQFLTNVEESSPELADRLDVERTAAPRIIRVLLYAVAAYSQYQCPVEVINLDDTFVFQRRRYTVVLTNPGETQDTPFEWNVKTEVSRHPASRLNPSALREVLTSFEEQNACCSELGSRAKEDYRNIPFKVTPEAGILPPGGSIECAVVFSPLEVREYKVNLACRMENLHPECHPLNIQVTARSLLPYFHFDIPTLRSDHSALGDGDKPCNLVDGPPGADGTRLVELRVIGVRRTHVTKFTVINPTAVDYDFLWCECDVQRAGEDISYSTCVVPNKGVAEHGKQIEFTFNFLANNVGVFESSWIFSIDSYELTTSFLFRVTAAEPSVYLIPGYLKMQPTIVGGKARRNTITIINDEDIQLPFRIIPASLTSEKCIGRLMVDPMTGALPPKGEQTLELHFEPGSEGEPGSAEFCIRCQVERMKRPLNAVIETTTYGIQLSPRLALDMF